MSHQLYAKIKRTSKYFNQNEWAKKLGEFPFPVQIIPSKFDDYWIMGGHVGQYRMSDVSLYMIENGYEIKLSSINCKRMKN